MIKPRLIVKLLVVHLVVIGFVLVVVWFSIDTLAAGYFVTLMKKYNISPGPAHTMFVGAVHRYLLWACLGAALLALVLSFLMMRRLLAPLTRMTEISREIAAGRFDVKVPVDRADEVGQLARAFNQMAASLEKLERLRRDLMIDVAHELRTPLTNIRGYLEALADKVLPPSPATLELLQAETLRLAKLVEDVLALARADAAHGRLHYETVDLPQMIRTALESFAPAFQCKSIAVDLSSPADITPLSIDRGRIGRVLRSLIDNAARYTPQGGTFSIELQPSAEGIQVTFSNAAPDLAPGDLPYLFERFYRGEKSRSRDHGGAGIGLAIVKELIEAHGGAVKAALENGKLRIRFTLPTEHRPSAA
jgi:signal transduction histidine kinase